MAIAVQPALSHLVVDDANAAIDFYIKAFGAVEVGRIPGPDGKLIHRAVQIDGATVMLADDFPEMSDNRSMTPKALGGTPVTIHLTVTDVETRFQQAVDAGATVMMPLEDQFRGDRYGVVRDPFGHQWSLHQRVVAFFDRLVQAVPILWRAVGHPRGVIHQPADQDQLELQTDLGDVGLPPSADRDLPLDRLGAVPRMAAQWVGVGQDPALVVVDDANSSESQSMSV